MSEEQYQYAGYGGSYENYQHQYAPPAYAQPQENYAATQPAPDRPAHPLAVFSPSGQLFTMFPKKQTRFEFNNGVQTEINKLVPGSITVRPLHNCIDSAVAVELDRIKGPLIGCSKRKLKKKDVMAMVEEWSEAAFDSDEKTFLSLLKLLVDTNGDTR